MKLLFITGLIVLLIGLLLLFLRKKNIPISNKKEASPQTHKEEKTSAHKEKFDDYKKISNAFDNPKEAEAITPKNNQQRNLDRETGGLEEEQDKKQSHEKDIWDGRSEEVDRMGSINQLGGHAKESMIWRYKKEKMDQKKIDKSNNASDAHHQNNKGHHGKNYDSRSQQGGFLTMVQARHDHDQGGGGR